MNSEYVRLWKVVTVAFQGIIPADYGNTKGNFENLITAGNTTEILKRIPPEYKCKTLPLHQLARFLVTKTND
jgi:hypothetical protein